MLLATLFGQFPFLKKLFADSAYAGPVFDDRLTNAMPGLVSEIVRRCDQAKGFVVLPPVAFQRLRRRNLRHLRPSVGSSREQSAGSTVVAVSLKTGRISITARSLSSASPRSA
jgi:hypothetical protein